MKEVNVLDKAQIGIAEKVSLRNSLVNKILLMKNLGRFQGNNKFKVFKILIQ